MKTAIATSAILSGAAMGPGALAQDWPDETKVFASDGAAQDRFGSVVALDDSTLVVPSPYDDGGGSTYVFRWDGTRWSQQAKLISWGNRRPGDFFGSAADVSGDRIIIGCPGEDTQNAFDVGAAYVFRRQGVEWIPETRLGGPAPTADDDIGTSVAIEGLVAIVGAPDDDTIQGSAGAAFVYRRNGDSWELEATLLPDIGAGSFGTRVSLNGEWAAVIDRFHAATHVYVFERAGGAWMRRAKLTGDQSQGFNDVAIHGDRMVVGANDAPEGALYFFKNTDQGWVREARFEGTQTNNTFGRNVSIYGDTAATGAFGASAYVGAVFTYRLVDGTWRSHDTVAASDSLRGDGFGADVALDGQRLVVGAMNDDTTGSAYIFSEPPVDSDGDGLPDAWESPGGGIDADGDGTIDLDLHALGARRDRKDIFVEIDAMVGRVPHYLALTFVEQAFRGAPVFNADGSTGIVLHLQLDETSIPFATWDQWIERWPSQFDDLKAIHFGTAAQRADSNRSAILAAKRMAYRYCVFADAIGSGSTSGMAEIGGNDFFVTLGRWRDPGGKLMDQAGTFMHELGHSLGLRHGGADNTNFKPNYFSVMNYNWQTPKYLGWRLDYSRRSEPTIDENDLSEPLGLVAPFRCDIPIGPDPVRLWRSIPSGLPVDFNRDGDYGDTGLAVDLNSLATPWWWVGDGKGLLLGHDDWSNLDYNFRDSSDYGDGAHEELPDDEITLELHEYLASLPGGCFADFTSDGQLDIFDFLAFQAAFGNDDPTADLDGSGALNLFDFLAFQTAFGNGC